MPPVDTLTQNPVSWTDEWKVWIALAALVQPWLIILWKKWFQRPQVKTYRTGDIELCYSNFGPTVALNGILKVGTGEVFVSAMKLEVVRRSDNATHEFEWTLFRSPSIHVNQPDKLTLELAAGFMLTSRQPHRYHVMFADNETQQAISRITEPVAREWQSVSAEATTVGGATRRQDFTGFIDSTAYLGASNKIERLCYWQEGEYELILYVHCSDPDRSFETRWTFMLTAEESEKLHLNSFRILDYACIQRDHEWQFVTCAYQDLARTNAPALARSR